MIDVSFSELVPWLTSLGPTGVILLIWWFDSRRVSDLLQQYQKDMHAQREMYADNVKLVTGYEKVANELIELIYHVNAGMIRIEQKQDANRDYFAEQVNRVIQQCQSCKSQRPN